MYPFIHILYSLLCRAYTCTMYRIKSFHAFEDIRWLSFSDIHDFILYNYQRGKKAPKKGCIIREHIVCVDYII